MAFSRVKVAHLVHVKHRDEVEAPMTDWLQEAYETSDALSASARGAKKAKRARSAKTKRPAAKKKPAAGRKKTAPANKRRR